jgi:RHS repeat-associated protein
LVEVTKYYYHGARRVAMRTTVGVSTTVTYLHGDHLGSTSLSTDADGGFVARVLYYPYGEERYSEGTLTTDYGFTGQRKDCYLDIYSMGAREYDPSLGRWLNADTIVPDPANPQSLNRYSYVYNNSLKHIDSSGHTPVPSPMIDGLVSAGGNYERAGGATKRDTSVWQRQEATDVVPTPPPIPDAPAEGDSASPWDVGVEWLTGEGDRHHEFRDGDPFTELLQQHEHIDDVRTEITGRLREADYRPGTSPYSLGGPDGVANYIRDYSTLATLGQTGNLAVTYLGSYGLEYYIASADPGSGTAEVLFHVSNNSTIASALRPAVIGYTEPWLEYVQPVLNDMISSGPMSDVSQDFWWTETIEY